MEQNRIEAMRGLAWNLKLEGQQKRSECVIELCDEVERLRNAIQRALDDEESGTGWGPDVTVCAYLREALLPPNVK